MKRINTPEEFKEFYPYKSHPNKKPCPPKNEYPKFYPCFCQILEEDGGIGGGYMYVKIIYPPNGVDLNSFELGIKAALNIKE